MLRNLFKPEYFFQPRVLFRRVFGPKPDVESEFIDWRLPWGMVIRIRPVEEHGRILQTLGVVDLVVSETLWRLANPGETQVDVGGNIGYMTSILGCRTAGRPGGCVLSFEANPEVFAELFHNVSRWTVAMPEVNLEALNLAVSDSAGTLTLEMPEGFSSNRGLSKVVSGDGSGGSGGRTVQVEARTLDNVLGDRNVGVLKIDVEGHELQVLHGARNLFEKKRVRDCVFEEHQDYPSPVTDFLEEHGYMVLRLHRNFFGPLLLEGRSSIPRSAWHPTNFLATVDVPRVRRLMASRGWGVLKTIRG